MQKTSELKLSAAQAGNSSSTGIRIKNFLFGTRAKRGFFSVVLNYFFLIIIGFAFLYPLLHILFYSFMSSDDLINPLVNSVPSGFYTGNYTESVKVLNYLGTLIQTLLVSLIPAIIQVASTAVIAYGFSRFRFPLKKLLLALVVATFIMPSQVTMIPQLMLYDKLGLIGNVLTYILPAIFGQGLKSAVFILIFFMFFNMMPKSFEEAGKLDGANNFTIFLKIAIPSVAPAIIISFLLSFVWYYNETTLASLYFGSILSTLPVKLQQFQAAYAQLHATPDASAALKTANEAVYMAGTFLCIVPMLTVYFIFQRFFTESVDKAGITGE